MRINEDAGRSSLQQEFRVKVLRVFKDSKDSNIAFKAIHEQEEWATGAPVCRAFGPLRDKGHNRETLIKYKWTIKVEYSRKILLQVIDNYPHLFATEPKYPLIHVYSKIKTVCVASHRRFWFTY